MTTFDNIFFRAMRGTLLLSYVVYCCFCCRFLLSEPCEDTSWRLRLEIADSSLRNAPRSVSRECLLRRCFLRLSIANKFVLPSAIKAFRLASAMTAGVDCRCFVVLCCPMLFLVVLVVVFFFLRQPRQLMTTFDNIFFRASQKPLCCPMLSLVVCCCSCCRFLLFTTTQTTYDNL